MSAVSVTLDDGGLGERLDELRRVTCESVVRATVSQMAEDLKAITPRETGSLLNSLRQRVEDASTGYVGYVADYAPHVEYGHRQNVGQYVPRLGKALRAPYVEGQHFLSEEVAAARSVMGRRFDEHMRRQGL